MGEDFGPEDVRDQVIAHLTERGIEEDWAPPDFTSKHEYLVKIADADSFDEVIAQACATALQTKLVIYSKNGNEEYLPENEVADKSKVMKIGRLTMHCYISLEGDSESPRRSPLGSVGAETPES